MKKLILGLAILGASEAFAEEGSFLVGVIGGQIQSPYIGSEDPLQALPYIAYDTDRLHVGVDGITYDAWTDGTFTLGVGLTPRLAPIFPDTPLFEDLDRDFAIEAGVDLEAKFDTAYALLSIDRDISSQHEGIEARAAVGLDWTGGPIGVDVSAGALFRDANLNNYLYGVGSAEATALRDAYDAGDTTTLFASISAYAAISDRTVFIAEAMFEDLGGNIDSPLVDKDHSTALLLGVLYQF